MKKLISISIPCFNEEENVEPMVEDLVRLFEKLRSKYDYKIQFIDNNSTDGTQQLLRRLCSKYPNVRAILNARNFPLTSGYYGIIQAGGDCTISIPADFQVPLDTIPKMIEEWEKGAKIVCLVKKTSEETRWMWRIRQFYYKIANKFSDTTLTSNFTGSGLYDKTFLDLCRRINDPIVTFGQIISTLGYDIRIVEYSQLSRKKGKSKNNIYSLIELAFLRFTNASSIAPRLAAIAGVFIGLLSLLIGFIYFVLKLIFWYTFPAGVAPILIGVFFMGGIQLFFIGLLGEYVVKINIRLMNRPLVVEKERINFRSDGANS